MDTPCPYLRGDSLLESIYSPPCKGGAGGGASRPESILLRLLPFIAFGYPLLWRGRGGGLSFWRISTNQEIIVGISIFFRDSDYYLCFFVELKSKQIVENHLLLHNATIHILFHSEGSNHSGHDSLMCFYGILEGAYFIAKNQ